MASLLNWFSVFVQKEMVDKMDHLEPEQRTKEASIFVFREVFGHRLGYARGRRDSHIGV